MPNTMLNKANLTLGLLLALPGAALAQFRVGDRVTVGSTGEAGTVIEVGAPQKAGGTSLKVHLDKLGAAFPSAGVWYDSAFSKVTAGAAAAAPAAAPLRPQPAAQAPQARPAPAAGQCKVGDRVAMPAGFKDKWFDAVVVAVDSSKPYPCRVHPLGYADTMNESFSANMLKTPGTIKTEPVGSLSNDPQLLAIQGRQAFKPTKVVEGAYECYALSGGRLSPRMALNFTITGAGGYKDVSGGGGSYTFDAGTGAMVFKGAALNGQRAAYAQPSNPPSRNTPPNVTFAVSGDSCDLRL